MSRNRYLYILHFILCVFLSGVAFYYNYVKAVPLCPLCSLQLLCYYLIGILSLVAFVDSPEKLGRMIYALLVLILSVMGLFFASRQVWLQHLPKHEVNACAPSWLEMFDHSSWSQIVHTILYGHGDCTMVHWRFLGLGMAAWSLLFFAVIMISTLIVFLLKNEPEWS